METFLRRTDGWGYKWHLAGEGSYNTACGWLVPEHAREAVEIVAVLPADVTSRQLCYKCRPHSRVMRQVTMRQVARPVSPMTDLNEQREAAMRIVGGMVAFAHEPNYAMEPLPDSLALQLEEWANKVHRTAARAILSHRDQCPPGSIAYEWALKVLKPMEMAMGSGFVV